MTKPTTQLELKCSDCSVTTSNGSLRATAKTPEIAGVIVTACNCHDVMLKALIDVDERLATELKNHDGEDWAINVRKAISKAQTAWQASNAS